MAEITNSEKEFYYMSLLREKKINSAFMLADKLESKPDNIAWGCKQPIINLVG